MHIAVMVSLSSDLARVGIDVHTRRDLLAVQSLSLFEDDEYDACRYDGCQYDKAGNKTYQAVGGDETDNGSACCRCRPINVSSLNA